MKRMSFIALVLFGMFGAMALQAPVVAEEKKAEEKCECKKGCECSHCKAGKEGDGAHCKCGKKAEEKKGDDAKK